MITVNTLLSNQNELEQTFNASKSKTEIHKYFVSYLLLMVRMCNYYVKDRHTLNVMIAINDSRVFVSSGCFCFGVSPFQRQKKNYYLFKIFYLYIIYSKY